MSDEVEISTRDELRNMFRLLCMGRPIAAEKLADMLAPLFEPAAVALPVLDMQALTTGELAALSTAEPEPIADASLDEHIEHVQAALAAEPQTQAVAPAAQLAPAKKTSKARKAR